MQGVRAKTSQARLLTSIIGALILAGAAPAAAGEPLKATLQSRYDAMKAAMAAHDAAALGKLLAPDFSSVDVSGKSSTASEMIAEVNGLKADPNKTSLTTLMSVAPVGNEVSVKQQYDMKTTRVGADGATHPIELISLSTDTWTLSGGAWLLRRTITDEMTLLKDGQVFVHKTKL